jgi:hypothetical protein
MSDLGMFDEVKQQTDKAAQDHPEQVEKASDEALRRGGDAADRATGDEHADQLDQAEHAADEKIGD